MRRTPPAAILGLVLVASLARADERPVRHEYVPDLGSDEGMLLVSSGGTVPGAIVYDGDVLPRPELARAGGGEPPMVAGAGDGREREEPGRRSPSFRPDRVTHLDGTVGYSVVFSPQIAPFKRVTALDRVELAPDGTPTLSIADPRRERVPVIGAVGEAPDGLPRDRFWGSVALDFREGALVPLPSVAPTSRILTLEAEPPVVVEVWRDGADNFYASAPEAGDGQVRVVFLTDAPRSYFGRPIPDAPVDVLAHRFARLPPSVQRDAEVFAAELTLTRTARFRTALETLTRYFRSFEESERPPENRGNIYLDLARGRRGICRHRAYAFVITAQALGIHARFVQNEAHAWVEVELPADGGWLRVDLGGAATGLEARGEQAPAYRSAAEDPLPRPPEYEAAYEAARRMSGGASRPRPGAGDGAGGGDGASGGASAPSSVPPAPGSPARGALVLELDARRFDVFRGRELEVTGRARGDGRGVAGLRIEALLRASRVEREWLLGVTVTDESGRFRAVVGVPPDLAVGEYRLVVRTPGDAVWSSAMAR
ncbi:MAG: transglutaminase domain-containing protein [Sandaracinaceae bacterium]|nr:transglutaminase domain-containing protein [Sandaracinaceae bacterium]